MTIASEIERIQCAKSDICTAIENKGVTVGDITLDNYACCIDSISTGVDLGKINIAMIGGGGGGGGCCGGGGGAGGYFCQIALNIRKDKCYTVVIGNGGSGGSGSPGLGGNGGCTQFCSPYGPNYIAYGGGGGGSSGTGGSNGSDGGSGGGASFSNSGGALCGGKSLGLNYDSYSVGQGNMGGMTARYCCNSYSYVGGGGGGVQTYGGNNISYNCGCGGAGCIYTKGGKTRCLGYGGGGGGSVAGLATGGGGIGSTGSSGGNASSYGSGGGGANSGTGGSGYKGIVIISYPSDGSWCISCATGGTKYLCGTTYIHEFTSNGTFCIIC